MSDHCNNKAADREFGQLGEHGLGRVGIDHGKTIFLLQAERRTSACSFYVDECGKSRRLVMPDMWDISASECHEVKVKDKLRKDSTYGLEVYRFNSLLELQKRSAGTVYYTIFDWAEAGFASSKEAKASASGKQIKDTEFGRIERWKTAAINDLHNKWAACRPTKTHCGDKVLTLPTYYWPANLWKPLALVWAGNENEEAA